jgi:hypothetical protein
MNSKVVLPPMSNTELKKEMDAVISIMTGDANNIEPSEYVEAVLQNNYWAEAGPFVVKELVFLDCLHTFYGGSGKNALLNDEVRKTPLKVAAQSLNL